MTALHSHPAADLFPLLDGSEFAELVADIRAHGLREPIVLDRQGRVLDGRNRARACAELSIEAASQTFQGTDTEAIAYVISLNLRRRHLNESQRALIAAELANLAHGVRADRSSDRGANLPLLDDVEGDPDPITNAQAANLLNVSERSVKTARKVREAAVPEVVEEVRRGRTSLHRAAKIAKKPKDEQARLVKLPTPSEARKIAKKTGNAVVARDGMVYTDMPEDQAKQRRDLDQVWYKLRDALDALLALPAPDAVLAAIPDYQFANVARRLPKAAAWLCDFKERWDEARRDADTAA